jgi:hypothetical protein
MNPLKNHKRLLKKNLGMHSSYALVHPQLNTNQVLTTPGDRTLPGHFYLAEKRTFLLCVDMVESIEDQNGRYQLVDPVMAVWLKGE